jgi:hypothetical protein
LTWIIGSVAWWSWSFSKWQYVENRDPKEVFLQVFHVPPPAGVREIKAAGYQPFNGNLWMVVRTDNVDGLLTAVGASTKSESAKSGVLSDIQSYDPRTPDERRYAAIAEWGFARHTKRAESHTFPADFGGSEWAGLRVVDRERHVVYVAAELY